VSEPGSSIAGAPVSGNGAGPGHDGLDEAPVAERARQGRPELTVGAAFAGGFVLALLLRRARS
jgi:hypothetical protein